MKNIDVTSSLIIFPESKYLLNFESNRRNFVWNTNFEMTTKMHQLF